MIPIDIQVSRWKVKDKGHDGLLHFVQWITEEHFAKKLQSLLLDSPRWVDDPYWYLGQWVKCQGHRSC